MVRPGIPSPKHSVPTLLAHEGGILNRRFDTLWGRKLACRTLAVDRPAPRWIHAGLAPEVPPMAGERSKALGYVRLVAVFALLGWLTWAASPTPASFLLGIAW